MLDGGQDSGDVGHGRGFQTDAADDDYGSSVMHCPHSRAQLADGRPKCRHVSSEKKSKCGAPEEFAGGRVPGTIWPPIRGSAVFRLTRTSGMLRVDCQLCGESVKWRYEATPQRSDQGNREHGDAESPPTRRKPLTGQARGHYDKISCAVYLDRFLTDGKWEIRTKRG